MTFRGWELLLSVVLIFGLTGCGSSQMIKDFENTEPKLVVEEYFSGSLKAWGLFQDRSGKVRRQFTVDIDGVWDGEKLTLTEDFFYSDGETERRVWVLTKTGENTYTGTADSVVGEAVAESAGNAFHLNYTFELPYQGNTIKVDFDDWMYLQDDQTLINRATVRKFGFRVGEATVFFRKLSEQSAAVEEQFNTNPQAVAAE